MNHLTRLAIRLYPRRWRARYEAEFVAMMEQWHLSPADYVDLFAGAAMAHVHELKEIFSMSRRTSWLLVGGPLLGLVLILIALTAGRNWTEDSVEFLILLVPLLAVIVMRPLAQINQETVPGLARFSLWLGYGSVALVGGSVLLGLAGSLMPGTAVTSSNLPGILAMIGLVGLGLWFVLAGVLALRGVVMPAALGLLSIVCGLSWLIISGSTLLAMTPAGLPADTGWLLGRNVLVWMLSYAAWAIGISLWFFRRRRTLRPV